MTGPVPLPDVLKAARETAGMSQAQLAAQLCQLTGITTVTRHEVSRWETGRRRPTAWLHALAVVLNLDATDLEAAPDRSPEPGPDDDAAVELLARLRASDVSTATLDGLARRVQDARRAYPVQAPALLARDVARLLREATPLLDARATLAQRRELLVASGWLMLLRACLAVDLGHLAAATRAADTARELGEHADHSDLVAWHHEIAAWRALLDHRHADVVTAARAGLAHTGPYTSVAAQLTAQIARASARVGDGPATRCALGQVAEIAAQLPDGDEATKDHFAFDPAKYRSYQATTLAWLQDGSAEAEDAAREVIATYAGQRRLATAHLDLGLILAARGDLDAADHQGVLAVTTHLLVPSSAGRARELAELVAPAGGDLPDVVRDLHL